jgi:hypothetical protein
LPVSEIRFIPTIKQDEMKVSNCCGAYPVGNGDIDSTDIGICPECGEHCEFENEDERDEHTPDWWNNLYTDANGQCFSDADPGL